jgi:hypothetical protein
MSPLDLKLFFKGKIFFCGFWAKKFPFFLLSQRFFCGQCSYCGQCFEKSATAPVCAIFLLTGGICKLLKTD